MNLWFSFALAINDNESHVSLVPCPVQIAFKCNTNNYIKNHWTDSAWQKGKATENENESNRLHRIFHFTHHFVCIRFRKKEKKNACDLQHFMFTSIFLRCKEVSSLALHLIGANEKQVFKHRECSWSDWKQLVFINSSKYMWLRSKRTPFTASPDPNKGFIFDRNGQPESIR